MNETEDTWVDVGKIGRPHGVSGEVVVHSLEDSSARLVPGCRLSLKMGDGRRPVTVVSAREMPKKLVVRFEGCRQPEDVKPWVGCVLQVPAREMPPLEEGEYYHFQLVGLQVIAADGRRLGVLEEILTTGGNDVYCVRREGRELLIPAIRDAIERVDLDAGEMVLKDLEGLIEP